MANDLLSWMILFRKRYHMELFSYVFKGWESILPCFLPYGKAGELQILCCQGIAVANYSFTLDALTLKLSDFCNVRVYSNE